MPSTIYFWKNEQLHTYERYDDQDSIRVAEFADCYAVYSGYETAHMRYGKYTKRGWMPVPLEDFPKSFLTTLLLLGIT